MVGPLTVSIRLSLLCKVSCRLQSYFSDKIPIKMQEFVCSFYCTVELVIIQISCVNALHQLFGKHKSHCQKLVRFIIEG